MKSVGKLEAGGEHGRPFVYASNIRRLICLITFIQIFQCTHNYQSRSSQIQHLRSRMIELLTDLHRVVRDWIYVSEGISRFYQMSVSVCDLLTVIVKAKRIGIWIWKAHLELEVCAVWEQYLISTRLLHGPVWRGHFDSSLQCPTQRVSSNGKQCVKCALGRFVVRFWFTPRNVDHPRWGFHEFPSPFPDKYQGWMDPWIKDSTADFFPNL